MLSTPLPLPRLRRIVVTLFMLGITGLACFAQTGTTVATANGRKISLDEIDQSIALQLLPLQQQIYALRKSAIDNYILKIAIEDEAKRLGISSEALRLQMTSTKIVIPDSDVESAYVENAEAFGQMSPDEVRLRLRLDMETQARMRTYRAAIQRLRENYQITVNLSEPILPIDISGAKNVIGNQDAPVSIIEYADFRCPHCLNAYVVIKQLMQTYGKNFRFIFKNLPLNSSSELLARGAVCSSEQGQFWQYHDTIFSDTNATLDSVVTSLGLDKSKFQSCQSSETSAAAVRKDVREARSLGINGTPGFVVNGKVFHGFMTFEEFKAVIDAEMNRK